MPVFLLMQRASFKVTVLVLALTLIECSDVPSSNITTVIARGSPPHSQAVLTFWCAAGARNAKAVAHAAGLGAASQRPTPGARYLFRQFHSGSHISFVCRFDGEARPAGRGYSVRQGRAHRRQAGPNIAFPADYICNPKEVIMAVIGVSLPGVE